MKTLILALLCTVAAAGTASWALAQGNAKPTTNSCEQCHSDPKFLVQNKKLYDYYRDWSVSIHRQEGVTCVDCHGGNPKATTKAAAHGSESLRSSDASSPINYANIPATCATCHEHIYDKYRKSAHFQHLKVADQTEQGPNCVTCHGSLNVSVLNVTTVRATCAQCHNEDTRNNPDIPEEAERVLNNFLSISRYYRFITMRSKPEDAKAFFQVVDPVIRELNADWHTFELDRIEDKTRDLLRFMQLRRKELKEQAPARR